MLAVIKARGFDHALEIANDTEFGLTGAVYTKSRDKIDRAIREFHVGNLYINRKCTGAMVGAHPFGGFNMSGTDSKSGGPDYLYLFTQAKVGGREDRSASTDLVQRALSFARADARPAHTTRGRRNEKGRPGRPLSSVREILTAPLPPAVGEPRPRSVAAAASFRIRWWMVNSASSSRSDTPILS